MAYNPTTDYADAYDALTRRIKGNFAGQRAGLHQDLATRGVATSGVSSIPLARLGGEEAGELDDVAAQFALEQASTGIEDRRSAEAFSRAKELSQFNFDMESALARRLGKNQLTGQVIGGGLAAGGALLAGRGSAAKRMPGY